MTKEHAQGVFIRFIDFRGELLLRASAIDGVVPSEKNAATYVYLNGTRLTVELPYLADDLHELQQLIQQQNKLH